MADKAGQQDILGLTISKIVAGFADAPFIFKQFLKGLTTDATQIRYFQKTAGILDSTDTTGITKSRVYNIAPGALPYIAGPSFTRNTANTKKFMVASEPLTEEDLKDNDVQLLTTTMRDLIRSVASQVDKRIFNVLVENTTDLASITPPANINYSVATATSWTNASGNPLRDLFSASKSIANNNYSVSNLVTLMNPQAYMNLKDYLVTKGAQLPMLATDTAKSGVVGRLDGQDLVVSTNVTTNYVLTFIPDEAAEWYSFMPLTSAVIDEPGIHKVIRVWEEGEAVVRNFKAIHLLSGSN